MSKMSANVLRRAKWLLPVLLLIVTLAIPAAAQASGQIHIVRPGENLYRIALHYGTTVQAIAQANGLHNPNLIYVGQRLIIPGGGGHYPPPPPPPPPPPGCQCSHVVRSGETLSQIAWRYSTSVQWLMQANGLWNPNYIWVGQRLCVPCGGVPHPACGFTHVVQRGETLSSIARRYGTCVQSIVAANHLCNPNYIWAGQRLYIPCQ
jgi:LysM repeat protein